MRYLALSLIVVTGLLGIAAAAYLLKPAPKLESPATLPPAPIDLALPKEISTATFGMG